jgi:hypothetical protein
MLCLNNNPYKWVTMEDKLMEEQSNAKLLAELKPKLWKRIVIIMIFVGISHGPFEGLATGVPVAIDDLAMGILGLVTAFMVWLDYYLSKKTYIKYKNTLSNA